MKNEVIECVECGAIIEVDFAKKFDGLCSLCTPKLNRSVRNELSSQRSTLFKVEGKPEKAIPYQLRILEFEKKTGNLVGITHALNYLSVLYNASEKYELGEQFARKALDAFHDQDEQHEESAATYNWVLALSLAHQRKYGMAVEYGERAVSLFAINHKEDDFVKRIRESLEGMIKARERAV